MHPSQQPTFHKELNDQTLEQFKNSVLDQIKDQVDQQVKDQVLDLFKNQPVPPASSTDTPLGILGFAPTTTQFLAPFGGGGGFLFQDDFLRSDERVLRVNLRAGNFVDAIQVVYENRSGVRRAMPVHGASDKPDRDQTFTAHVVLDADEFITGIFGRSGVFLDSVFFTTNVGQYGPVMYSAPTISSLMRQTKSQRIDVTNI